MKDLNAEGPAYSEGFQAGKMFAELEQAGRIAELEAEIEQLLVHLSEAGMRIRVLEVESFREQP